METVAHIVTAHFNVGVRRDDDVALTKGICRIIKESLGKLYLFGNILTCRTVETISGHCEQYEIFI